MLRLTALPGLLGLLLVACGSPVGGAASTPAEARLITEDAERFWQVWDAAAGRPDAAALQAGYLDPATPGLRAFLRLRICSAEQLAQTIRGAPAYYAGLRGIERRVEAGREKFRASFEALEALYPPAVFPDVYFLVGRLTSAGTLADEGLLIGLDMYGRHADASLEGLSSWHHAVLGSPDDLPLIVAHELIHYQQFDRPASPSLLDQSVLEGAADFIAERIAGGHLNLTAHAYGLDNECALWREFAPHMHGDDVAGFLYQGDAEKGRPADLGYFIGYRIVAAYVARRGLSEGSLRDVLGGKSAAALLDEGGYTPCTDTAVATAASAR